MQSTLAHGYARQVIFDRPDISLLFDHLNNGHGLKAWDQWRKISWSKKFGRAQQKFINALPDFLPDTYTLSWKKSEKTIIAEGILSSQATPILDVTRDNHRFRERGLVSGYLQFGADQFGCHHFADFTTTLSNHAILRMFERDIMTASNQKDMINKVMEIANSAHSKIFSADGDSMEPRNFAIPFLDGALILRTCKMRGTHWDKDAEKWLPADPDWVLSVRTWLRPDMVGDTLYRTMGYLPDASEETWSDDVTRDDLVKSSWLLDQRSPQHRVAA